MESTKKLNKKLSGAQNRKLRPKKDVEIRKQPHALNYFIQKRKEKKAFDLFE